MGDHSKYKNHRKELNNVYNNSNFDTNFKFIIFLNYSQVNLIDISRIKERFLVSANIVYLYEVSRPKDHFSILGRCGKSSHLVYK